MPKTVNVSYFRFEELSEKAQDNVRYRNEMLHAEQRSDVTERLGGMLADLLVDGLNLEWALAYCQGDGVAFYGHIDAANWLANLERERSGSWVPDLTTVSGYDADLVAAVRWLADHEMIVTSSRNDFGHHYSHYNTMSYDFESHSFDGDVPETHAKAVDAYLRGVSRYLECEGYDFLEGLDHVDNLKYHFAGAWFDADGILREWDDEEEREAHIEALEAAETVDSTAPGT